MKKALILLGHGSRHEDADRTVRSIVAGVRKSGRFDMVSAAFLQYTKPGPDEVLEQSVRDGASHIVIVPFFLQPGRHVAKDVPELAEKMRARHPGVTVQVTELVGSHPLMERIVADLAEKG